MTWWHWHRWGLWQVVAQGRLVAPIAASLTGFWYVQERVCQECQWRERRMREVRPSS